MKGKQTVWEKFKTKTWYEPMRKTFWRYPDRLMALKVSIAMAVLVIPFVLTGKAFLGVTLGLGAVAGALSETDDHPKGRIKALLLIVFSFALSSASVELLRPFPILFAFGLAGSTFLFILIGGMGERYRGVTFGALLVAIYTMLGTGISPAPYWQPILLPAGALFYGLLSLILLYIHPWRLLEEQLARGYQALSDYMREKARLFPSDAQSQEEIRNRLSILNTKVVTALERCKDVLNSYADAMEDQSQLRPYLHRFMLLQSLHERAASSHERYDLLSSDPENKDLLEGLGQLLLQISYACSQMADSLLTSLPYKHPVALKWTVKALHDQQKQHKEAGQSPLSLLLHNLTQSHLALQNIDFNVQTSLLPRLDRDVRSLWERLKAQLNWEHPRLRYAIRLSTCFVIGYTLVYFLKLEKGDWVLLTSLFVCQPSYSETRRRLFQRIMGTLLGVVAGVLIVQILPTLMGQLVLMLSSAFAFFSWLRHNYATSVVFITIFVLAAFNVIAGQGVAMMGPRILDTLIGALLALGVVRFLWPDWQHKRLPSLLAEALEKNASYCKAILEEYKAPKQDDLNYRIARRQAHQADNALALAWKGMKLEPRKQKRFQQKAFQLTYLNHALLSYLSALGAHRNVKDFIQPDAESGLEQIGNSLQEISQSLRYNQQKDPGNGMKDIIESISRNLSEMEKGTERQKLVLLYNIAEVTDQLLQQSYLLRTQN